MRGPPTGRPAPPPPSWPRRWAALSSPGSLARPLTAKTTAGAWARPGRPDGRGARSGSPGRSLRPRPRP
eukprot:290423-Lingulodinium_polyedra.AAC.1